jgi:AcrR family transcriptional regulator
MSDRSSIGDREETSGRDPAPIDRRHRRHEEKRARIIAEAWDLARRDGLAAISLRDLAARVDLRQPSLYAYFDSKMALYDAMYIDAYRQFLDTAGRTPVSDDPREALVEFVEMCVRFATDDVVRHQLMFQRTIPGFKPSPEAREIARAFQAIGQARLTAIDGFDIAAGDGLIFTGIAAGFAHQQVFNDPNGDRWLRLVRRVMEMFLADVERRSAPKRTKRTTTRTTSGGQRK